jgi:hypothetical protein
MSNDGKVVVRLETTRRTVAAPRSIVLRVIDAGPGLPAELGQEIFTPFVSTKETGLGLGLVTSRRIAESDRVPFVGIDHQLDDSGNRDLPAIGILGAELVVAGSERPVGRAIDEGFEIERGRFRVFRPRLRLDESQSGTLLDAKPVARLTAKARCGHAQQKRHAMRYAREGHHNLSNLLDNRRQAATRFRAVSQK